MKETTVRLLGTASILMLLAGGIFCFTKLWIYVALMWTGAFCCAVAVMLFKNRKSK